MTQAVVLDSLEKKQIQFTRRKCSNNNNKGKEKKESGPQISYMNPRKIH